MRRQLDGRDPLRKTEYNRHLPDVEGSDEQSGCAPWASQGAHERLARQSVDLLSQIPRHSRSPDAPWLRDNDQQRPEKAHKKVIDLMDGKERVTEWRKRRIEGQQQAPETGEEEPGLPGSRLRAKAPRPRETSHV